MSEHERKHSLAHSALIMVGLLVLAGSAVSASVAGPQTGSAQSPSLTPAIAPSEGSVKSGVEREGCRRLTDFEGGDTGTWFIVNDGVMGGRSDGGGFIADSLLRFEGTVVTAGGGFTSVRLGLEGDELVGSSAIEMRVRPDGRMYGITLEDAARYRQIPVSHRADLDIGPVDADGWAIAMVSYDELVPSVFGVLVDAPPYDPATASEVGIIIADGIDGGFALDIDWIDACP